MNTPGKEGWACTPGSERIAQGHVGNYGEKDRSPGQHRGIGALPKPHLPNSACFDSGLLPCPSVSLLWLPQTTAKHCKTVKPRRRCCSSSCIHCPALNLQLKGCPRPRADCDGWLVLPLLSRKGQTQSPTKSGDFRSQLENFALLTLAEERSHQLSRFFCNSPAWYQQRCLHGCLQAAHQHVQDAWHPKEALEQIPSRPHLQEQTATTRHSVLQTLIKNQWLGALVQTAGYRLASRQTHNSNHRSWHQLDAELTLAP